MIRMRSSTNHTENSHVGSLVTILIISMAGREAGVRGVELVGQLHLGVHQLGRG